MHTRYRGRYRILPSLLGLLLITTPHAPAYCADDYLDALQAEAMALDKGRHALEDTTPDPPANWSSEGQGLQEELSGNLSRRAFEEELQHNFFGTYMFYTKLNNTQRDAVYAEYKRSGSLGDVRNKITELLKR